LSGCCPLATLAKETIKALCPQVVQHIFQHQLYLEAYSQRAIKAFLSFLFDISIFNN